MQECVGDNVLRGAGVAAAKSAALSSVSTQPSSLRKSAEVTLSPGAAAEPSKKFAVPYPTKSTMDASCAGEQTVEPPLQASPVVDSTNATLPADPLMFTVPVAS